MLARNFLSLRELFRLHAHKCVSRYVHFRMLHADHDGESRSRCSGLSFQTNLSPVIQPDFQNDTVRDRWPEAGGLRTKLRRGDIHKGGGDNQSKNRKNEN